jgi:hypothetical protein
LSEPVDLSKAHIVKALITSKSSRQVGRSDPLSISAGILLYCGSYTDEKLLLSRISWKTHGKVVMFSDFSIRSRYLSIRNCNDCTVVSNARWDARLSHIAALDWPSLFRYRSDIILHNRTSEFLYKLYTRACMTGHQVEKYGHSKLCTYCGLSEDELHAVPIFSQCGYGFKILSTNYTHYVTC